METVGHNVESIVDVKQPQYNDVVFEIYYLKMRPETRAVILALASAYSNYGKITAVYAVGSLLTLRYTDRSDLDINVIMTPHGPDSLDLARHKAAAEADVMMLGSSHHPVNFFVETEFAAEKHEAIYDVLRDTWVKQADDRDIDVDEYWNTFQAFVKDITAEKAELMDDLWDYDKLKSMRGEHHKALEARVNAAIEEIDTDVKTISGIHGVVHGLRKASFSQQMSPQELKQYQVKNKLPANVLYKLLQRYSYLSFLQRVKAALRAAGGSIDTDQDVDKVKAAVEEALRKGHVVYGILNSNLESESHVGDADSVHSSFTWDMPDRYLVKRWRYKDKEKVLFVWDMVNAKEKQAIAAHIKQMYNAAPAIIKTPDIPQGVPMRTTEAQVEKAIDALLKEMTGAGAAGGYELPLGAKPYWMNKRKKKKSAVKPQ